MHPSLPRVWLLAGCGEGPSLARALLAMGWQVKVSVVTAEAARAYRQLADVEISIGAIGVRQPSVEEELQRSRGQGRPFRWVIDATHPFASQISSDVARTCGLLQQPLLRLQRPELDCRAARVLADVSDLQACCGRGERILLAIGARRLSEALRFSAGAIHHARILPRPGALRQALAAGLAPDRLVCLQPHPSADHPTPIEAALIRRWRIQTLVCRRSGGPGEAQWGRLAQTLQLRLLLLERPSGDPAVVEALGYAALLNRLGPPPASA